MRTNRNLLFCFLPYILNLDTFNFFDESFQKIGLLYDKNTFFLSLSFILILDKISFNVLKNIFVRYIPDLYFWGLINELLCLNFQCLKNCFSSFRHFKEIRFFEYLVIEIYLKEVDKYLIFLFNQINFTKSLFSFKKGNLFKFVSPRRIKTLSSLFISLHYLKLKVFYNRKVYFSTRAMCFKRFNNNLILSLLSSKRFSQIVMKNVKSFLQGNLHIYIFFFSLIYISSILYFMDYKIVFLVVFRKNYLEFRKNFKVFFILTINRKLKLFNKINFKFSLNRLYFELTSHVNVLVLKTQIKKIFIRDKRIWDYIFQLESKRCFQFSKLVNSLDFLELMNYNVKRPLFYFNLKQSRFFLQTYLLSIQKIYRLVANKILIKYLCKPITNFDSYLNFFLVQFSKNLNHYNLLMQLNSNFFSYPKIHINLHKYKQKFILVYCPILLVLKKLRVLGFIHSFKNKPVGNTLYVVLEDYAIIQSYLSIRCTYHRWYKFCNNAFTVKKLIDFFFIGSVITVSRKHKKNHGFI